jgi:hypothetical protein
MVPNLQNTSGGSLEAQKEASLNIFAAEIRESVRELWDQV